jgi:hypothetical protein
MRYPDGVKDVIKRYGINADEFQPCPVPMEALAWADLNDWHFEAHKAPCNGGIALVMQAKRSDGKLIHTLVAGPEVDAFHQEVWRRFVEEAKEIPRTSAGADELQIAYETGYASGYEAGYKAGHAAKASKGEINVQN